MNKTFLLLTLTACLQLSAQSHAKNWHLQYNSKDTNYGIGLIDGLNKFQIPTSASGIPLEAKPIVVAVIDDGVDIKHPDLQNNIWVNTKEIPGNAVDDDHNGYIDDINGWDFLGNLANDIEFDNFESTRLLRDAREKFKIKDLSKLSKAEKAEYKQYLKMEKQYQKDYAAAQEDYDIMKFLEKMSNALLSELDSSNISYQNLLKFDPKSVDAKMGYSMVVSFCKEGMTPKEVFKGIREDYEKAFDKLYYHLNIDFDSRKQIGDNYEDAKSLGYGNQNVMGPDSKHGSHVAGIIAATRDNRLGIDGIAPKVKIMCLRVVPNGDERDKDVAHAIRYAVDNGAKIINMSFGKSISYNAAIVREAIRYAESKNVLMVHAAGNEHSNNDDQIFYPSAQYQKDSFCKTWIEVGASDRDQAPADFSNYGKNTVDVFAPGVQIYSTVSNSAYDAYDGTSMASPVVAGIAALIWSYYPNLTAVQVKQIIESSVVKPEAKFIKPGKKRKKTTYKKLCKTAGIVNVENALKAAASFK